MEIIAFTIEGTVSTCCFPIMQPKAMAANTSGLAVAICRFQRAFYNWDHWFSDKFKWSRRTAGL
jgi:hypothetical protein